MGLILDLAGIYVPQFMRKRQLERLFEATAGAFAVASPSVWGLSYDDSLKEYARFTREQARKTIQQGNELKVQSSLFQNACRIGRQFRADFKINTAEDVMRAGALVYRLLKIDFQAESGGAIVIKRCFFSAYYSGDVCRLISSLDEGLFYGLSGGGRLNFTQRITEGNTCCRARLLAPGSPA
jgi:hypothetical protein